MSTTESISNVEPVTQTEDVVVFPVRLQKMLQKMDALKQRVNEHRKEMSAIYNDLSSLEKTFEQYAAKVSKTATKTSVEKRKRKPSGFASPTAVSPDLCIFMEKPVGSLISRTETSRFLSKYISDNHLYNDTNKSIILPDAKLANLLGSDAVGNDITYFTIQRYMNRHFLKKTLHGLEISANA
jgi:chromatin remodeling complex protein RSC6